MMRLILILILVLMGCQSNNNQVSNRPVVRTEAEFASWVDNNKQKLVKQRVMDKIHVDVVYLPNSDDDNSVFSFILKFSPESGEKIEELKASRFNNNDADIMYWTSEIKKHLKLMTDKDTMNCQAVAYENFGNLTNNKVVNIGFSGKRNDHSKFKLVYDDQYFEMGKLIFEMDDIIMKTPIKAKSKI